MKQKKYKIIKRVAFTALTVGLISSSIGKKYDNKNTLTYVDSEFLNDLNTIRKCSVVFKNQELYNYLVKEDKNIREIRSLSIREKLDNSDFSDLKYLTNLEKLTIANNDIDLSDLEYNQNLKHLEVYDSNIINTYRLPNTINDLYFVDTIIKDGNIVAPFKLKTLYLKNINAINLYFKEPNNLENMLIDNAIYFDIANLSDCHNIKIISIKKCVNVFNSWDLLNLKLDKVILDDYAPIWMDVFTANNLPIETVNNIDILSEIRKLDVIAESLNDEDESKKLNNIIQYIVNKYEYNNNVANNSDAKQSLINYYYNNPVSSSLIDTEVIDINYATLFVSLCRRLNITATVQYNSNYMWNKISDSLYDLTSLDNNNYSIDNYESISDNPVYVKQFDIGYLKSNGNVKYFFNEERFKKVIIPYIMILFGFSLVSVGMDNNSKDAKSLVKNKK